MAEGDGRRLLITGGAGYIGAHLAWAALEAGHELVVLDNLSTGAASQVPPGARLVRGDIGDPAALAEAFDGAGGSVDAVLHLAASSLVAESVAEPQRYYRNNVHNSQRLLQACLERGVGQFIFSSTAAVYAASDQPVDERAETAPLSPYGRSKLMFEQSLRALPPDGPLQWGILRYFNVAGADSQGRCGELAFGNSHLIKATCELLTGKREQLTVHGDDYPTPDGTCIRDYVHVEDIARAHLKLLTLLRAGDAAGRTFNCGSGRGFSVREVLETATRVAGTELNVRTGPRRPGDPPVAVADVSRIFATGWRPERSDLQTIIASALAWEKTLPPP